VIELRDDRGRKLTLLRPARTVVSLVPSDTYSMFALGVGDRLVGRTEYCVEPADRVAAIPTVGGTKNADVATIVEMRPDVVVANQEESSRRDLERIAQAGIAVYVSFPKRVADGLAHLAKLSRLFGVEGEASVKERLRAGYEALREAEAARSRVRPLRAFLPIWMDPLMTISGETFISDALDLAGAYNVFSDRPRRYPFAADLGRAPALPPEKVGDRDTRYPRITTDEIVARAPEIVILPDEPHAFDEQDADVFRALPIPAAERGAIVLANGKDFSWYGARALEGLATTRRMIDDQRAVRPLTP
jgi:ABC-type Fe3+-hydroxamate transport system substrate-binding protein